eukprot:s95_g28.t1
MAFASSSEGPKPGSCAEPAEDDARLKQADPKQKSSHGRTALEIMTSSDALEEELPAGWLGETLLLVCGR